MSGVAEYLIETADRCIGLANSGRRLLEELRATCSPPNNDGCKDACERIAAAGRDLADELDAISQELMAKAVEIDAQRQKSSPGSFGP
jgi:hypothetical protein